MTLDQIADALSIVVIVVFGLVIVGGVVLVSALFLGE